MCGTEVPAARELSREWSELGIGADGGERSARFESALQPVLSAVALSGAQDTIG